MATAETVPAEDWAYEALRDDAEALRGRINRFRSSLGRFLVAKQELIDLMVVAAVAQARSAPHSGKRHEPIVYLTEGPI
jgi:MoxR-like ATPase